MLVETYGWIPAVLLDQELAYDFGHGSCCRYRVRRGRADGERGECYNVPAC
jgi:hypothetical protein